MHAVDDAAQQTPPSSAVAAVAAAVHPAFDLVRSEHIEELAATAHLYVHRRSGAQLLSVVCDEEEKVFGAAFKTPPPDETGRC
jgi:Zn-dependent M16 (insulinase) family peptidase